MSDKIPMLNLKRKIGEITEIEIDGKVCQVILKDIDGKVCTITFKATRDFKITRSGVDLNTVENTIEKREDKFLRKRLKVNSSLGGLAGSPHKEGTLSFGEYRNRSIRMVPAFYLDYHLDHCDIPETDKQLIEMEKKRRRDAHIKKESL